MFKGEVVAINIGPRFEEPMKQVESVRALEGKGLEGDRYAAQEGTFSKKDGPDKEVTLIEAEALDAASQKYGLELGRGDSRRNIVTRGVPLNHLVGRRFNVGDVVLEGMRLAEPCGHLEKLTQPGIRNALIHRGGLRARIVTGGVIHNGDLVEEIDAPT